VGQAGAGYSISSSHAWPRIVAASVTLGDLQYISSSPPPPQCAQYWYSLIRKATASNQNKNFNENF
jgi:hypothetical protein